MGCYVVDMRVPGVGRIQRSAGTRSLIEFRRRLSYLRRLRAEGHYDLLRQVRNGHVSVAAACLMVAETHPETALVRRSRRMVVYIVQLLEPTGPGAIKIGVTRDLSARMHDLEEWSPYPIRVLAARPGFPSNERLFHKEYQHLRLRGEWFRPAPELYALARSWGWNEDDDLSLPQESQ